MFSNQLMRLLLQIPLVRDIPAVRRTQPVEMAISRFARTSKELTASVALEERKIANRKRAIESAERLRAAINSNIARDRIEIEANKMSIERANRVNAKIAELVA